MQSDGDSGLRDLEARLVSKERELKELQAVRVHQLESSLIKAQKECSSLREHYKQLREDFLFNLAILDERDRELEKYDAITARALTRDHNRYNPSKEAEERQEDELRQQEHEFNVKMDKMRAVVLSHEIKVKLLSKETEVHCQAQLQATQALKASKELCQQMKTQLQHKDQELKDIVAIKDNRYVPVMLAAARTNWDQYIKQVSSEMVVKDTEIITMQERETKLRTELENSREQIERYKQQVSTGLKRERTLEQIGVQAELEWQRRYEDIKAEHYLANEQLIQDLTEAKAELKEKQQELQDLNALLHSVRMERDHAVQGLTPKVDSLASEEINRLQVQNSTLRAVVTQMRKDMEGLSQLLPRPQPEPQASPPQPVHYPGSSAVTSNTLSANTQVATGLLAQTDAIFSKVGPAVCLHSSFSPGFCYETCGACLDEGANNPALIKQVRVTHVESAPTDIIQQVLKEITTDLFSTKLITVVTCRCLKCLISSSFQSAPVQQFQEENQHLQLQALGLISGGLLEKVHCAKSNPSLLRARLKQAASCIARLSRDKQQLIEMGNRLRAQITTHSQTSVCLTEPVEPERDTSTDKQGDQHDRLSVLEQLQYQLTTQVSELTHYPSLFKSIAYQ
uniref:Coiled-coil domain-containing protein 57 n=1 Tax=Amphiprion percula TaxID=161767 RepID=A0A3P8T9M5_AMPPE